MKLKEQYIEALKLFNDYVTVLKWAEKVVEIYPDILEKVEQQVQGYKYPTTGLKEIAARISAILSNNAFTNVDIDPSERPKRVKYITPEELKEKIKQNVEEDTYPLTRNEIIKNSEKSLENTNLYRIKELNDIQLKFKQFLNIDFEVDHAKALLNKTDAGAHHPDNLQLLLKYHNSKKNSNNWDRFNFKEQKEYILKVVELQKIIDVRVGITIDENIVNLLLSRLEAIYKQNPSRV
jgi:hypothetical protein